MKRLLIALSLLLGVMGSTCAAELPRPADTLPPWPADGMAELDADVHLAAVAMSVDDAPVTVRIASGVRPIVLVVASVTPVEWRLAGRVERVKALVMIHHRTSEYSAAPAALIAGLPEGVPAYRLDVSLAKTHDGCPLGAPATPAAQCLDPALRVTTGDVANIAKSITGFETGLSGMAIGWRTGEIAVPGTDRAEPSLLELHERLTRIVADAPQAKAFREVRDRLARFGDPLPFVLHEAWRGLEMHVVDLAPCPGKPPCSPRQRVTVPPTGHSVVLILGADRDAEWIVHLEHGADLAGVVLTGTVVPIGLHLPAGVPVSLMIQGLHPEASHAKDLTDPRGGAWSRFQGGWSRFERYKASGAPIVLR